MAVAGIVLGAFGCHALASHRDQAVCDQKHIASVFALRSSMAWPGFL